MSNDTIEYKGETFTVFDDQFDWNKALEYYQSGELEHELSLTHAGSTYFHIPIQAKQLLDFYLNSDDLVRAIVDYTYYLSNESSFANEIKLAIQSIEEE